MPGVDVREEPLELGRLGPELRVARLRLLRDPLEPLLHVIAVGNEELELQRLEIVVGNPRAGPVVEHGEERVDLAEVSEELRAGPGNVDDADRRGRHLLRLHDVGELPSELEPLTTKPLLELVNGGDGIDLQLEAELAELSPEEAAEFRGSDESALGEVVRRLAETLDLITFFTAGEKETRAWTLRRGETALDAAATIHSDIARGFIRAEVTRTDDFLAGGQARLEGKNYVVEDGDVLNIRFNV